MLDLLFLLPGLPEHWGRWIAGVYFAIGFRIGLSEALKTRRELARQDVADSLWPTLGVLTVFWPLIFAARFVFWLILAWDVIALRRADMRDQAGSRSSGLQPGTGMTGRGDHV